MIEPFSIEWHDEFYRVSRILDGEPRLSIINVLTGVEIITEIKDDVDKTAVGFEKLKDTYVEVAAIDEYFRLLADAYDDKFDEIFPAINATLIKKT